MQGSATVVEDVPEGQVIVDPLPEADGTGSGAVLARVAVAALILALAGAGAYAGFSNREALTSLARYFTPGKTVAVAVAPTPVPVVPVAVAEATCAMADQRVDQISRLAMAGVIPSSFAAIDSVPAWATLPCPARVDSLTAFLADQVVFSELFQVATSGEMIERTTAELAEMAVRRASLGSSRVRRSRTARK